MLTVQAVTQKGIAGALDPDVKSFLNAFNANLNSSPSIPFKDIPPEQLRSGPSVTEAYDLASKEVSTTDITFINRDSDPIALRVYRKDPRQTAAPLLFFHGGCWVFCDINSHDSICRTLCYETGLTVISVNYRLAPEHKFPKGLNDCFDATKWVHQNRETLQLNQDGIILAGDSAGGNLATCVSMMSNHTKELTIKAQVLFYPITDISNFERESYRLYSENYFLTRETIEACGDHYTHNHDQKQHDLISPFLAQDFSGLPSTLIQTAEFDILRDEAENYAQKLLNAEVDVECVRYNGLIHAYLAFAGGFQRGAEALDDAIQYIKRHA